jgi:hypothetical protein
MDCARTTLFLFRPPRIKTMVLNFDRGIFSLPGRQDSRPRVVLSSACLSDSTSMSSGPRSLIIENIVGRMSVARKGGM